MRYRSTEAGLQILASSYRAYMQTLSGTVSRRPRIRVTSLGTVEPSQMVIQSAFLRLVSTVEATVDALSAELTEGCISAANQAIRRLAIQKELAGTATWQARQQSYKLHHDTKLIHGVTGKKVEAAVEVRNSIAHGLGTLTTRQRSSRETSKRLGRIGIVPYSGAIRLHPDDVAELVGYGSRFLRQLDDRVP